MSSLMRFFNGGKPISPEKVTASVSDESSIVSERSRLGFRRGMGFGRGRGTAVTRRTPRRVADFSGDDSSSVVSEEIRTRRLLCIRLPKLRMALPKFWKWGQSDAFSARTGSSSSSRSSLSCSSSSTIEERTILLDDVGMTAEPKYLYADRKGIWRDTPPDLSERKMSPNGTRLEPESSKFALIVRREKVRSDLGGYVLELDSIIVQSPLIKKLLKSVFEGYVGINTDLKTGLTFNAPFRQFYHRWDDFCKARPSEDDKVVRQHYQILYDVISPVIIKSINESNDEKQNGVISSRYVWTLFPPGTTVYSKEDGHHRLFILERLSDEFWCADEYTLTCRYIDTDGNGFGSRLRFIRIHRFPGVKPISELEAVPSQLQPGIDEIWDELERRGRLFETFLGSEYREYTGVLESAQNCFGMGRKKHVEDARIMVDHEAFDQAESIDNPLLPLDPSAQEMAAILGHGLGIPPARRVPPRGPRPAPPPPPPGFARPPAPLPPRTAAPHGWAPPSAPCVPVPPASPQQVDCFPPDMNGKSNDDDKKTRVTSPTSLSPSHYVFCSPTVKGFCFKSKTWAEFSVDCVRDITWNDDAFAGLVLPHDYKEVVLAFAHAQLNSKDDFDDIVKGKGRGIIMLLSGEPGTGKTLTAESVAERMRSPLYTMSAGELGAIAPQVERQLVKILELSERWGAVLLIDESDVFLERRSSNDMERNRLVAVFLRLLEYYKGVMFLTTNRVEDFDPAFESRIHMTINYPNLDAESRLHIWHTFMAREMGGVSGVGEDQLVELAQVDLNGRQIKNVIKTAKLLASRDQMPLALEHVETVLRVKRGVAAGEV